MNNPEELQHRLEVAMDGMRRAMINARERLSSGLQVTRTQLEILMLLSEKPRTTGELAKQLFLTQSAVTQTVDTLVRRELVERHADEHDRRIIRLALSSAGQTTLHSVLEVKRRHLRELMARLEPAEAEALITATEKAATFIEELQDKHTDGGKIPHD